MLKNSFATHCAQISQNNPWQPAALPAGQRRLQAREGGRYPDFAARWIPLEEAYFTQHNIEDAADFVMDTTTD